MTKYTCKCCEFETHIKTHYERHLRTKKHEKLAQISQKLASSYPKLAQIRQKSINENIKSINEGIIVCKYCDKEFKHKSSLSKHIKYSCKKNEDEDLKELVRLLNDKNDRLIEHNNQMYESHNRMQKQIDKLTKKLQIQQIGTQNNNNTNNIVNYTINNYIDTDYTHLTHKDYLKCFKDTNHCVKSLIEKVHLNESKPENMNIYIPSLKDSYIMVYKDGEWMLQDRKEIIDELYEANEYQLEAWYEEFSQTYPDIVKSFQKYLENKEEDSVVNDVKKKILLDFYNKRKLVTYQMDK